MTKSGKIIVVTAYLEFPLCPTVFVGTTNDGETIRARYRFGYLVIRLDPSDAPHGGTTGVWVLDRQLDPTGIDGNLSYEQLREHTADLIEWPADLSRKVYDDDDIIDMN